MVFGAGAAVPVCRGLPLRTLAPRGTWAQAQLRGAGLVLSANAGRMVGALLHWAVGRQHVRNCHAGVEGRAADFPAICCHSILSTWPLRRNR